MVLLRSPINTIDPELQAEGASHVIMWGISTHQLRCFRCSKGRVERVNSNSVTRLPTARPNRVVVFELLFFGWHSVAGPSKEAGDTADPDPDHIPRDRKT